MFERIKYTTIVISEHLVIRYRGILKDWDVCMYIITYLHNKRWRRHGNNVKVTLATLSVSEQNK